MAYNINNGIKPTMNVDHVPNEKPTRLSGFPLQKITRGQLTAFNMIQHWPA